MNFDIAFISTCFVVITLGFFWVLNNKKLLEKLYEEGTSPLSYKLTRNVSALGFGYSLIYLAITIVKAWK